jgi:hypothetical protein
MTDYYNLPNPDPETMRQNLNFILSQLSNRVSNININSGISSYFPGIIRPEDYGAIGNGQVDDTVAVQNAASAAGDKILLLSNKYLIYSGIRLPEHVHMMGMGKRSSGLIAGTSVNAVIPQTGCTLSNFYIDGTLSTTGSGILIQNYDYCVVQNMFIKNFGYHGLAICNSRFNKVFDIDVESCGQRGVILDPTASFNQLYGILGVNCGHATLLIGHGSHHNEVYGVNSFGCGNCSIWIHNESYNNKIWGGTVTNTTAAAGTPGILLGWNAYYNIVGNFHVDETHTIGLLLRGGAVDAGYNAGDTRWNRISHLKLNGPGKATANSAGIKIDSFDSGTTICEENKIHDVTILNYYYGVWDPNGDGALNNYFYNIDTPLAYIDTTYSLAYVDSDSHIVNWRDFTPASDLTGTGEVPTFPATGNAATNVFPYLVQVFVIDMPAGGTISIDGNATGSPNDGNGMYMLQPGQTITPTYGSGTPSWKWFGV